MSGEEHHKFGSLTITAYREPEAGGSHGSAYCPLCEFRADRHDQEQGSHYAVNLAVSDIRAHLRTEHQLEEPEDIPPAAEEV